MRLFAVIVMFLGLGVVAAHASDAGKCVQTFLNDAHLDVGTADGSLGKQSKLQAERLRNFNPDFGLPALSEATATQWCTFAGSDKGQALIAARAVIDTVAMTDAEGPKKLWAAYDHAKNCGAVPGEPEKLSLRSKDSAKFDESIAAAMQLLFPPVAEGMCPMVYTEFTSAFIKPVVEVTSGDSYFDRDGLVTINIVGETLSHFTERYLGDKDEKARKGIVKILVNWAKGGAFSEGIRQPSDEMSVKFDVLEVLPVFIVAFGEVGPTMELADRMTVGTWLRRLVGEVQYSAWGAGRQDNKNYLRNYVTLLWGLLTNDAALERAAIEEFKTAIYDMRPDGSFPRDSSRGGSGLHYSARATMMLFAIADVAQLIGEDLFAYETEGRSLHTAINWVGVAGQFNDLNTRHARPCDQASAKDFTVENPDPSYLTYTHGVATIQAWASVYAKGAFAKPEVAQRLMAAVRGPSPDPIWESPLGGYYSCFASGIPRAVPEH